MGQLVEGVWKDVWYDTKSHGGRFKRQASAFRNWITHDGSPGRSGKGGFKAEPDRYHLYVSLACPWAHRVLVVRKIKGLERFLPVSIVSPIMREHGWTFDRSFDLATGDPINHRKYLYEVYTQADPKYSGRVTVPVLWDKKEKTIVNNESSEIIEMLNTAFDGLGANKIDLYPANLRKQIEEVNDLVYDKVNNGVYKCGFATSQEAYDENVGPLFNTLDHLESVLSKKRYLMGDQLTLADVRLWTTLARFDYVYVTHFKCDKKRIMDYPNLYAYLRDIYQIPGVAETVSMDHIRHHYFCSHPTINPNGIVSVGPSEDWNESHGRDKLVKTSQ